MYNKKQQGFHPRGYLSLLAITRHIFSFSCMRPCDLVGCCPTVPSPLNQTPNAVLIITINSHPFHAISPCICNAMCYFMCDAPTRHLVLGKGVTNLRTINLLTYIIINNYLESINLQKYFIYIQCSGIYNVLYIYYKSHLLVLLGSHCLQNFTFTLTKSIQTYL